MALRAPRRDMFHDSARDPAKILSPATLSEALCKGIPEFTSATTTKVAEQCVALCHMCPELQACRQQLSLYRTSSEWNLAGFSGVWAGVRYSKGRPAKRRINKLMVDNKQVIEA